MLRPPIEEIREYIIGFEVDDFRDLPEGLPENTVTCICSGGTFAKMSRTGEEGEYDLWDYFIGDFRKETDYVFDKNHSPCQIFNMNAGLLYAYEPVKIPKTGAEKYDSIRYAIVTLPAIHFTGVQSNLKYCTDVIDEYFSKYSDAVDLLPNRKPYIQDFLGFVFSYRVDNLRCIIERFHQRYSASLYVPIERKE